MAEKTQALLLAIFIGFVLVIGLALGLLWVVNQDIPTPNFGNSNDSQEKKLTEEEGEIKVDGTRIPTNNQERKIAAPLVLLPNRQPQALGNQSGIPLSERAAITKTVNNFLASWETFSPRFIQKQVQRNRPNPYRVKLAETVIASSIDDVYQRLDSIDPDFVCPENDCISGSIWSGGKIDQSVLTISDYSDNSAYVTGYGIVTYTGDKRTNPLAGQKYLRSYGLILEKTAVGWMVYRASSESIKQVNYF
jgi:hypothetical protein